MRVLVTGPDSPVGRAIVAALVEAGHQVRAFGGDGATARSFPGTVAHFPGDVAVGGSIEPALSERQALVHAACCDGPGRDRQAHAAHVERGTLYARYGAEREQVDHFVHVTPAQVDRRFAEAHRNAARTVEALRGPIQRTVVRAASPQQAARDVVAALAGKPALGKQPGRENDAVTA